MIDKSVVLKTTTVSKKDKNINISLIREKTKVFKAALIVQIRVEQKLTSSNEKSPIHSQANIIKKQSKTKKRKITLVAKRFRRYKSLFMKASRYMYSTPKYRAKEVNVKTNADAIKARLSIQKTRCESTRSKQKNQRPKSMQEQFPSRRTK